MVAVLTGGIVRLAGSKNCSRLAIHQMLIIYTKGIVKEKTPGRHRGKRNNPYSSKNKAHDRQRSSSGQHWNKSNRFNKPYYPNENDGNSGRNQNKYRIETTLSQDRQWQNHRNKSSGYGNTGNYNIHPREAEATYGLSSYVPGDDNKNNTSVIADIKIKV